MSLQHHILLQDVTASCDQVFQPFTHIYRKMECFELLFCGLFKTIKKLFFFYQSLTLKKPEF